MTDIKTIKATGKTVVLKMVVKEKDGMFKKNKSGLYLPNDETMNTQGANKSELTLDYAEVFDIGKDVEDDTFNIGDKVVFNEYDIKYVGSKENMFGIVKESSIMAVYETEEDAS